MVKYVDLRVTARTKYRQDSKTNYVFHEKCICVEDTGVYNGPKQRTITRTQLMLPTFSAMFMIIELQILMV